MTRKLPDPPPNTDWEVWVFMVIIFLLVIAFFTPVRGQYLELDAIERVPDELQPGSDFSDIKRTWGCVWFPYVDVDDWDIQSLNRINNKVRLSYDTNKDGYVDTVHEYVIEGVGSRRGSNAVPVLHATPTKIYFDLDYDKTIDVTLYDTSGNGGCADYRAEPIRRRHQSEPDKDVTCFTEDCDKKHEGDA